MDHARHVIVAVGAVIFNSEGELLLVKHVPERGGFWKARWICPGGKLRVGETIVEGIHREVAEETGLAVELLRLLPPFERIHRLDGQLKFHVLYVDYTARVEGTPEPRCGGDVGEARWFGAESLSEAWEEVHPDTQTLLELAGATPPDR